MASLSDFQNIHRKFTQKWEGGCKFTKNPKDPGGATKFGISFRFLQNLPIKTADTNKDGAVTWRDVEGLSEAAAEQLFYDYFWVFLKTENMPTLVAGVLYDAGVNLGVVRAAKILQYTLGVTMDGNIGNRTLSAVSVADPLLVAKMMIQLRNNWYHRLKDTTEWADDFIKGWLNRTDDLLTFMGIPEIVY